VTARNSIGGRDEVISRSWYDSLALRHGERAKQNLHGLRHLARAIAVFRVGRLGFRVLKWENVSHALLWHTLLWGVHSENAESIQPNPHIHIFHTSSNKEGGSHKVLAHLAVENPSVASGRQLESDSDMKTSLRTGGGELEEQTKVGL
jgi:hypothetical protein